MHTLAFDGQTGASGDMILGALIDLGADQDRLASLETTLDITYELTRVSRHQISATHVQVTKDGDPIEHTDESRTYEEVLACLDELDLPEPAHTDAAAIFEILGEAEAQIHNKRIDDIHFHEVGADDAIADIAGAALLITDLNPTHIVTTPIATGGGSVTLSHGSYPVPPPAVVTIAEHASFEIHGGPTDTELLTPTGAAILAHYATGVSLLPSMTITGSGYGAGSRDLTDYANVLRVITGQTTTLTRDEITVLETNVDDVSPEILGSLHDTLTDAGARDVAIIPLTMKKSRPGHLIQVIAKPTDADTVARRLADETGTLGIRHTPATHRFIANREYDTVTITVDDTEYELTVKLATDSNGTLYDISAEYDDAYEIAQQTDQSVRELMRRAETTAWETH